MESLRPLGGFGLPRPRNLSRLYNDTKKSSDFVKEPVRNEQDPEINTLHRKLRIQKDRFVNWGLEWSDPSKADEMDESFSKAGLSELVANIMSNVKEILNEAEQMWHSYKPKAESNRPSPDRKAPLVQWDKGRFKDLIGDLTCCIDTLSDVSQTRTSKVMARRPTKPSLKPTPSSTSEDFRPFESSRRKTPRQINPATFTPLQPAQADAGHRPLREVVVMSKTAYSELTHGTAAEPWAPLLLEYATFDALYSMTGIMPPMDRFEKLFAGLQEDPQRGLSTWTGLPRLFAYFEDMENSRLGLVYHFPPSFKAEKLSQSPGLPSLSDMLARPDSEPQLEAKFRLAHNLANTVFDMHARGIAHGKLSDSNVTFCNAAVGSVDFRRPLISSFDVFAEESSNMSINLTRHPLDPRVTPTSPLANMVDERILDLYSLAMALLSIGLWTRLEDLVPHDSSTAVSQSLLTQLAVRCGSVYAKAVQACWDAVDEQLAGRSSGEALLSNVQLKVGGFLEACCILDDVNGLELRLSEDISAIEVNKWEPKEKQGVPSDVKHVAEKSVPKSEKVDAIDTDAEDYPSKIGKPEVKLRLYPHIALSPDVVDKWNTILMPQINHALRQFYRKHPESVEISLESVGPNPSKTMPTVLVVCTSVGKVRAILKKRLGNLFDGSTGFALKVCRGHVLRSHRQSSSALRSMARRSRAGGNGTESGNEDEDGGIEPVNPHHQERPGNGASIGAWIGDRHLPPVSFGGLVIVDDKPYGMTVHHMLDDPDRDFGREETMRSSGIPGRDWYAESLASTADDDFSYELSDGESEDYSDTDITSDDEEDDDYDDDDGEYNEPGDIPGIEPGCGDGYIVTQPALDDVEDGFYPCAETEAEDHIDTFSLGEVYASSGIRRRNTQGLVHEVDWALFQFSDERLPDDNFIPKVHDETMPRPHMQKEKSLLQPTTVAPTSALPGMEVQCVARTSGLQTGQILPALTSVKIYGRASPSHTYQVASVPPSVERGPRSSQPLPMGIPGDSGAWIVDRQNGHLCGHVLAWSQRKHVAYICPMDVLLQDIAQTLNASEVRLPGGQPVALVGPAATGFKNQRRESTEEDDDDDEEEDGDDYDEARPSRTAQEHARRYQQPSSNQYQPSTPIRLDVPGEMPTLTSRLEDMGMGGRKMGAKWLTTCADRP